MCNRAKKTRLGYLINPAWFHCAMAVVLVPANNNTAPAWSYMYTCGKAPCDNGHCELQSKFVIEMRCRARWQRIDPHAGILARLVFKGTAAPACST